MKTRDLHGVICTEIELGEINLLIANSVGPRILSFTYRDSGNIFAELPNEYLEFANKGKYHFYGGHRLWVAPEIPEITYIPDNQPIIVNQQPNEVNLIQEKADESGLRKSIQLQKTNFDNILIVNHVIYNEGKSERKLAPWAITQFILGGTAILPYTCPNAAKNPFLPNRTMSLWPYTDPYDPRIKLGKDLIFIETEPVIEKALKVGIGHFHNWIAYFANNFLFIKYSAKSIPDCSLDMGAVGQCYCNNKFIELESIGSYREVMPGAAVEHREVWRIVEKPFSSTTAEAVLEFMRTDDMADSCRRML